MVACNNIFIGVMSSTFNQFEEKAPYIFVQNRARIAFEYLLLRGICGLEIGNADDYLWICRPFDDEVLQGEKAGSSRLRRALDEYRRKPRMSNLAAGGSATI